AEDILVKEYKEGMKLNDALNLGVSILKKINEKKLSPENMDISTVVKSKGYKQFSIKEISSLL
ncbi:MAG: hypothetical protein M1544_02305, partial [Candidatus Marsarchaeota archaeon]|nr:hypothetical protein [Candidatus Marsarchaeota archaeon]